MNYARQSTAKTFLVGPILDADGVAKTDEVVASIAVTKNGSVGAVDAQDTLTHNHTGQYVFVSDGGDFDTVGVVEFSLNSGTNAMAPVRFQVIETAVYDALFADAAPGYGTAQTGDVYGALPANFSDLSITETTGRVSLGDIMGSELAAKVLAARNYAYQDDGVLTVDLSACDTDLERGAALDAAITAVQALTPGGAAISATNRARLLIPEAHYNVADLEPTISVDGTDLMAVNPQMGGHRQPVDHDYSTGTSTVSFRPPATLIYTAESGVCTLIQSASNVRMRGFGIANLATSEALDGLYISCDDNAGSQYDDIYLWHASPVNTLAGPVAVRFAKHVNGVWTRCIGNAGCWRVAWDLAKESQFYATMIDCEGGVKAFIGDHPADVGTHKATGARLIRCKAIGLYNAIAGSGSHAFSGCSSFGIPIDSTCYFEDCEAGHLSFGPGAKNEGTFVRCRAGDYSFGATKNALWEGEFAGYAEDCYGGYGSFGGRFAGVGDLGKLSGTLDGCESLGHGESLRVEGATIDRCLITALVNVDAITLLDSTSKISHSTVITSGTGKAINAASALTFYGVGNSYVGGLGANVTAGGLGDEVDLVDAPNATAVAAIQAGLSTHSAANVVTALGTGATLTALGTAANQTTIMARLGAWTGTGVNTVLGAFKALLSKVASAPSDIGGTFTPTTDSIEAIQEAADAIYTDTHTTIPAAITAIEGGTGTGARTVTITVDDGADPLESARVRFTKGAESYVGSTNASGVITFSLDDGTWNVAVSLSGYTFTPTTLVVDGDETETYSMTQVSFTASDAGFITGYCYARDTAGEVVEGAEVQLQMSSPLSTSTGTVWDGAIRTITSDVNGLVEITNLVPGASYRIRRGDGGWQELDVASDAADPMALPDFVGED